MYQIVCCVKQIIRKYNESHKLCSYKLTLLSLICDTHEMNIQRQTSVISNFLYIEVYVCTHACMYVLCMHACMYAIRRAIRCADIGALIGALCGINMSQVKYACIENVCIYRRADSTGSTIYVCMHACMYVLCMYVCMYSNRRAIRRAGR